MKKILAVLLVIAMLSTAAMSSCIVKAPDSTDTEADVQSEVTESLDDGEVEYVHSGNPIIVEPSNCPLSEKEISQVVKNATDTIENSEFSGTVLISVGNTILFEESYGDADGTGKVKNTNDTYYQIGSVTKQFTGTAILLLEREGKIRTSDTLDKYFEGDEYLKTITISNLLEMTAGMGDYMELIESNEEKLDQYLAAAKKSDEDAKQFIIDTILEEGIYTDPGTVYSYSNSSYYLLGIIIEQLTGMSYSDYVQQTFFDPADMTDTFFVGDGKDYQTGYSYAEGKYVSDNDDKYLKAEGDYPYLFSAGAVVTTVEDMNKWLDVVISGDIITKDDYQKVEKAEFGYNYGWNTLEDSWHHSGRTYAYSSQIYLDYETDAKLVMFSNISFYDNLTQISFQIFNQLNNQVVAAKK